MASERVTLIDRAAPSAEALMPGSGHIETRLVDEQARVVRLACRAPLKLLVPRHRGKTISVFSSTYGGGLLAGDAIELAADCGAETTLFLRSQSATKVYRSENNRCSRQTLSASVGKRATLISMPDPVTCFAHARYAQKQLIHLNDGASVLLLDWMTNGRSARGETWAFDRFESRTEIVRNGRTVFMDAMLLDRDDLPIESHFRGGRFECLATLLLTGPGFSTDALALQTEVDTRKIRRREDVIVGTSAVAGDGLLLRLAATSTERAIRWLAPRLQFLSRLTGEDPFTRKW